jgi:hypothetical protein
MGATGGQRTLYNFDVTDPFDAPTLETFRERFRALHGHNPTAADLRSYYERHPDELARRRGSAKK